MLKERLENLREDSPLVHNITNYVTANDCANLLYAVGARPIMADDPAEAAQITENCDSLNINIGTLNESTVKAMFASGHRANAYGLPVVFDPVGAGASDFRKETAGALVQEIRFAVIKGNVSEIRVLAGEELVLRGVDGEIADTGGTENEELKPEGKTGLRKTGTKGEQFRPGEEIGLSRGNARKADEDFRTEDGFKTGEETRDRILLGRKLAKKTGAVIVMTGETDVIVSEEKAFLVQNGDPAMKLVTGCGCQLSALIAAFAASGKKRKAPVIDCALAAVTAYGLCGQLAKLKMKNEDGNGSYRNYILDSACHLTGEMLEQGALYTEVRE